MSMQAHRNPFLVAIKTSTEVCNAAKKYLDQAQELTNKARASVLHYDLLKSMHNNNLHQNQQTKLATKLAILTATQCVNNKIEILSNLDISNYDVNTKIRIIQHREALRDLREELDGMRKFVREIDKRP